MTLIFTLCVSHHSWTSVLMQMRCVSRIPQFQFGLTRRYCYSMMTSFDVRSCFIPTCKNDICSLLTTSNFKSEKSYCICPYCNDICSIIYAADHDTFITDVREGNAMCLRLLNLWCGDTAIWCDQTARALGFATLCYQCVCKWATNVWTYVFFIIQFLCFVVQSWKSLQTYHSRRSCPRRSISTLSQRNMFLLMRCEVPERDHVQSNLVRGHLLDLYRTDHQRTRIADSRIINCKSFSTRSVLSSCSTSIVSTLSSSLLWLVTWLSLQVSLTRGKSQHIHFRIDCSVASSPTSSVWRQIMILAQRVKHNGFLTLAYRQNINQLWHPGEYVRFISSKIRLCSNTSILKTGTPNMNTNWMQLFLSHV